MCMISYVPAGISLSGRVAKAIANGADTNDDGHGWAIANGTEIRTGKSMVFANAWADCVATRDAMGGGAVVFHSRIATHGTVNEYNCHPFDVIPGVSVMAHNGILEQKWQPDKGDPRSDTRKFIDNWVRGRVNNAGIPSRREGARLAELIGNGNKLVFLGIGPVVRIVNNWAGYWEYGCWFSNSGYQTSGNWRGWYSSKPVVSDWQPSAGTGTWTRNSAGSWEYVPWAPSSAASVIDSDRQLMGTGWPYTSERAPARAAGALCCGGCGSTRLDIASGLCRDCLWCLDCDSKWDDCDCYMSRSSVVAEMSDENEGWR